MMPDVKKSFTTVTQTDNLQEEDFYYQSSYKGNYNNFDVAITTLEDENKKKTDNFSATVNDENSRNNALAIPILLQDCSGALQGAATTPAAPAPENVSAQCDDGNGTAFSHGQNKETTIAEKASPRSSLSLLLLLPGVTDRRKSFGVVELSMAPAFNSSNSDDVSTEIGSESRNGSSSSANSRCSAAPFGTLTSPGMGAEESTSDRAQFGMDNSESVDLSTTKSNSHQNYSKLILPTSFEEGFDNDATPENRFSGFLRNSSTDEFNQIHQDIGKVFSSSANGNMMAESDWNDAEESRQSNPYTTEESIGQQSNPSSPLDTSTAYTNSSVPLIPGLFSVQSVNHRPLQPSSTVFLPWRIKYISTNTFPNSHECLTDATTADDPDDDDDDEADITSVSDTDSWNNSNLDLPCGVSKKVRFVPLQESEIYEYERFDWYDEADEIGIFVGLDENQLNDGFENDDDSDDDDAVEADPVQLFIPLIAPSRQMFVIEDRLSDGIYDDNDGYSSASSSPRTQRHNVQQGRHFIKEVLNNSSEDFNQQTIQETICNDSILGLKSITDTSSHHAVIREDTRSASLQRRNKVIKCRDCTPHPNRITTSRSDSNLSLQNIRSSSSISLHNPDSSPRIRSPLNSSIVSHRRFSDVQFLPDLSSEINMDESKNHDNSRTSESIVDTSVDPILGRNTTVIDTIQQLSSIDGNDNILESQLSYNPQPSLHKGIADDSNQLINSNCFMTGIDAHNVTTGSYSNNESYVDSSSDINLVSSQQSDSNDCIPRIKKLKLTSSLL